MREFRHHRAQSLDQAVEFLNQNPGRVRPLGGGTDLLGGLKDAIHPVFPKHILDLKRIQGLDRIESGPGGLRIGALVRLAELEFSPQVGSGQPMLAQAARAVASPQIRNMGTLGGNICQEVRCWYYRHPDNVFHCLRKGGQTCNAFVGDNRYHSIFGAVRVGRIPCRSSCPAETDIPAYMELLRAGDLDGAAREILRVNPLPALTGRVCPHFCQEECNRSLVDGSVSIRSVERFLGDYILDNSARLMPPPAVESGRRAAVVGSGPAGLAAAYFLRRAGHGVTLLERLAQPGGMLSQAIPDYRLPQELVGRVVAAVASTGVEIKTGVEIGQDLTLAEIRADFDAVFLATGAWGKPSIGLEGQESAQAGLDFLRSAKQGEISSCGPRVVVVGGGNVAVDVAVTARRLGAERVTMVCLESRAEMPAHQWEIAQAEEEGVVIKPSWGPVRVAAEKGRVRGLELNRCLSVFDDQCRFAPVVDRDDRTFLEADQVVLAVGQRIDLSYLGSVAGPKTERGRIAADGRTQATDQERIFAGGDAVSGPATVIEAVAAGRRAAQAMAEMLGDRAEEREVDRPLNLVGFSPRCLRSSPPAEEPLLPPEKRLLNGEDAPGLDRAEALGEAERCFNCGCVAASPSDLAPVLVALEAVVETTRQRIPAEEFFAVRVLGSTVLEPDELVTAVVFPDPGPQTGQAYLKFRLRNAIDFPILGAAVLLWFEEERVKRARIVLGAAAPVPVRALAAEGFLVGKALDGETALEAARLSVASAQSLSGNRHKIKIAQSLVRRALLQAARGSGAD